MAKRRMLSIPIIETDKFYKLSTPAQALYMHLNLNADDDGIVDKTGLIMKMMNLKSKTYDLLVSEGYIIDLGDGLTAITHWLSHNRIKSDRYVEGQHKDLIKSRLKTEKDRYIKASGDIFGDICAPQDSIGKDRSDKGSTDKESLAEHSRGERRKEKESISLSLSYIHSDPASQVGAQSADAFSLDSLTAQALKNNIRLYFMKKYQTTDTFGFIEHYEARGWIADDGLSIVGNFREYIDSWMANR